MREVLIYILSDPRTPESIRYVGKTVEKRVESRITVHIGEAKSKHKCHKCNWLRTLIVKNIQPSYKIVDICDESNWIDFEKHYIAKYRIEGHDLTNATDGGEGMIGVKVSKETREKLSIFMKKAFSHPEIKEKYLKKIREFWKSDRGLEVIKQNKGRIVSQEEKEMRSRVGLVRGADPEYKKLQSRRASLVWWEKRMRKLHELQREEYA